MEADTTLIDKHMTYFTDLDYLLFREGHTKTASSQFQKYVRIIMQNCN